MRVELSYFLAIFSSAIILIIAAVEFSEKRGKTLVKKDAHLKKGKCEVCASLYFVSSSLKYWRCPFCNSLNS